MTSNGKKISRRSEKIQQVVCLSSVSGRRLSPLLFSLLLTFLVSCGRSHKGPDVSGVVVNSQIERFDQAFFALDSNQMKTGLFQLNQTYPWFLNDFTVNILGAGPLSDTSEASFAVCRRFLTSYLPVKDSISMLYPDMKAVTASLKDGLQHVSYYFPKYALPQKNVAFIGPFDAPGVALTRYTLAIGLQLFAGPQFSFYHSAQGQELFPTYISRRFAPEYIPSSCMKALSEDIYPDKTQGKPMIEQMVEKGKYWWLLDRLLPETADSLKTGFSARQLDWCEKNEGPVWNLFLQTDLYTVDPELIKTFLGDGPKTDGMPDVSPGNIGQWVGWRIVQKYAAAHPDLNPEQLISVPARSIFSDSKYKPK